MSVGFVPRDGATVYWKNGERTSFTYTGSVFPNTPQAFYKMFGQPKAEPDPSKRSLNLIVEAETAISTGVSVALERAARDPGNPWGLRPGTNLEGEGFGYPTALESYMFAATQLPNGWAGSALKKDYFDQPGSTPPPPIRPPKPPVESPPPPLPPALSTPEQRAAELHAWVGQKWEQAGPVLRPIIAELVVMFRKAVGK